VSASGPAWSAQRLRHRRAVEALRSGVPNADAVLALGSGQSAAEDTFTDRLSAAESGQRGSMLVSGGFGEGKSHLLTHLAQLAGQAGFVVSTVVVSKETPLHDPAKVLRAAVESAVAPGGVHEVLGEAATALDPESSAYAELLRWVHAPGTELDERFAASLYLLERLRQGAAGVDEELGDTLVRFWAGDPLPMPELRRALRAVGAAKRYAFAPVKARELARQRLTFLPRLLQAAGWSGWVVLLDEVELIGRYSVLQRARSYAELARWLDGATADFDEPVVVVAAITDDYEAAVLAGKNDRELVPTKLRDKQTPEHDELATLAEAGMRHIERRAVRLVAPDDAELDRAYATLRQLHGLAHDWSPPDVAGLERLGTTRMRQHVRAWINEWDLVRQDPRYTPSTRVLDVSTDYREAIDDPDA
jgi:hypothetical protein